MDVDSLVSGNDCFGSAYDGDYRGAGCNDCLLASIRAQHSGLEDNKAIRGYLVDQVRSLDLSFFA